MISGAVNEEWRTIDGHANYQVSTLGNVRNVKTELFLKPFHSPKGYLRVDLRKPGSRSTKQVHQLVASAFIPNPLNKPLVDHIDHCVTNNTIMNLRWVDNSENMTNMKKRNKENTSSIYKGVSFHKWHNKWNAQIGYLNKRHHIGSFYMSKMRPAPILTKLLNYSGEFALLNDISDEE